MSRRGLLQAAGGFTFFALAPGAEAFIPEIKGAELLPVFTAVPYLQPGPSSSRLVDGKESVVIAWEMNQSPGTWLHEEDAKADYVQTMISDRHSLTIIDLDAKLLTWRQIDEWGNEIDRASITKAR